jgi:hypothetical protein
MKSTAPDRPIGRNGYLQAGASAPACARRHALAGMMNLSKINKIINLLIY